MIIPSKYLHIQNNEDFISDTYFNTIKVVNSNLCYEQNISLFQLNHLQTIYPLNELINKIKFNEIYTNKDFPIELKEYMYIINDRISKQLIQELNYYISFNSSDLKIKAFYPINGLDTISEIDNLNKINNSLKIELNKYKGLYKTEQNKINNKNLSKHKLINILIHFIKISDEKNFNFLFMNLFYLMIIISLIFYIFTGKL